MRGSFKLALGVGVVALVAWSVPACGGGDDSSSGGKGGSTGGKDGGKGGTGGSGGGMTCGSNTCSGWTVGGLLAVSPCCAGASSDKCAADVDTSLSTILGIPVGCYELNQVGNKDCACPNLNFINPLNNKPAQFDGCCTPDGKCGAYIDTTSDDGPLVGCQENTKLNQPVQTCSAGTRVPPPDGGSCPNPGDGGGTGGTSGDASAD